MGSRCYKITRAFIFECLNINIEKHNLNLIWDFVIIPNRIAAKKIKTSKFSRRKLI